MRQVGSIDVVRCMLCRTCVALCPGEAIEFDKVGYCYKVNEEKCVGCGKCVKFCPYGATSMEQREDE